MKKAALSESTFAIVRSDMAKTVEFMSGGGENFAAAIEGAYQDVLDGLGMVGFWLVATLEDGMVCGWSIGCRNGALVSIPDANNDAVGGDGEALIEAAWQAFLFARTATIASVTRAEQDAEKAKASA